MSVGLWCGRYDLLRELAGCAVRVETHTLPVSSISPASS